MYYYFAAKEGDGSSLTMNFSTITPTKGETVVMNMTYFLSKKTPIPTLSSNNVMLAPYS